MGIFTVFKATSRKAVVEGERGLIMLLEKLGMDDVVDESQIMQYEEALNQVSVLAAKAERTYKKEQEEFAAAEASYNEKLADANTCQQQILSTSITLELKHKLENHLNSLLDEIEGMKPELDREKQEALDAYEHYNMLKETVEIKAGQLAQAKDALKNARRKNQALDAQLNRAKEREEQQKVLLGIREQVSTVDSVLNAINSDTAKKEQELAALRLRTNALKEHEKPSSATMDPEVAAALGKGASGAPVRSAADRLAALQKK